MDTLIYNGERKTHNQPVSFQIDGTVDLTIWSGHMDRIGIVNGVYVRRFTLVLKPGLSFKILEAYIGAMGANVQQTFELTVDVGPHAAIIPIIWRLGNLNSLSITGEDGIWKAAPATFSSTLSQLEIPAVCLDEEAVLDAFAKQESITDLRVNGVADPKGVAALITGVNRLRSLRLEMIRPIDIEPIMTTLPENLYSLALEMRGGYNNRTRAYIYDSLVRRWYLKDRIFYMTMIDRVNSSSRDKSTLGRMMITWTAICELISEGMEVDVAMQVRGLILEM